VCLKNDNFYKNIKDNLILIYEFKHTKYMQTKVQNLKLIILKLLQITTIICILMIAIGFIVIEPNFKFFSLKNMDNSIFVPNHQITVLGADNTPLDIYPTGKICIGINEVSQHTIDAFTSIEDHRYFEHNGFDLKRIAKSIAKNIISFKYKEGASTITQQLVKNTQLSPEKKISRKINEIRIAREIERNYSKNDILEQYFNILYFGKNIYGLGTAAKEMFGKKVQDLDISESATLAGIINSPILYSPYTNYKNSIKRRNLVLSQMLKYGKITSEQFDAISSREISLVQNNDYLSALSTMIGQELQDRQALNKDITVYTNIDKEFCQSAYDTIKSHKTNNIDISCILIDNFNNNIIGALSTQNYNLYTTKRQPGSTLKPLLVYAPSLQYNLNAPLSPILDQRTVFDGKFNPKNFKEQYMGWTNIQDSLALSLNVPAVKVLQQTGISQSKAFASNLGIEFDQLDDGLPLALGAMQQGIDLPNLTNAYSCFANLGVYKRPNITEKIQMTNNNVLPTPSYRYSTMRHDTAELMTNMLMRTVTLGTAKKLNGLGYQVAAKTGTVGNESGNTDAYCIAYTSQHSLGVWVGGQKMPNSITGGTLPTLIARQLLTNLYQKKSPPNFASSGNIINKLIDKGQLDCGICVEQAHKYVDTNNKILGKFSVYNPPSPTRLQYWNYKKVLEHLIQTTHKKNTK